ncbi:hypothetical protein [Magnetovibrio blakemorei]|uniref:Uncharacterized protein n=1 Tax=Magnetovibrio blakemorei TaxID=28181 RepID=A0A1E5Q999_9PROT|nr:hypothetical protein [Magnetovibrio blakemorei]OEJ67985.1 hypothetical protein BEN30_06845 [Magnetovibrio blakemorei]
MIVLRLAVFLMALIVFVGVLVLCVLTMPLGLNNAMGIIGAAGLGTLISIPVTYFVAKKMSEGMKV